MTDPGGHEGAVGLHERNRSDRDTSPGQRRPVAVVGVLAAVAAIGAVVLLVARDRDGTSQDPAFTAEEAEDDAQESSAPESFEDHATQGPSNVDLGEGILLVDSGFSSVPNENGYQGHVGLIVENTADEVRHLVGFDLRLFDDAGALIEDGWATTTLIGQGERRALQPDSSSMSDLDAPIGRVEVTVETPCNSPLSGTSKESSSARPTRRPSSFRRTAAWPRR